MRSALSSASRSAARYCSPSISTDSRLPSEGAAASAAQPPAGASSTSLPRFRSRRRWSAAEPVCDAVADRPVEAVEHSDSVQRDTHAVAMPDDPASRTPPPRLHVLPAARAPVAAVLRRGPSAWCQVLRWRLDTLELEPGAWMHAKLYPRRCAVSPDGTLLCAFVLASRPAPWTPDYAVSKLPWLTALAAWRNGSTWAPPCQFHDDGSLAHRVAPARLPTTAACRGR